MPFGETRVEERKRLIELWETGWTPTELARKFEVSRPTVYEWIERWQNEGKEGLEDRCSRPHNSPKQTGSAVVAALLNMKDQYGVIKFQLPFALTIWTLHVLLMWAMIKVL